MVAFNIRTQEMRDDARDGRITWDEARSATEGLKIDAVKRPIVVHKDPGCVQIGDLPLRQTIGQHSIKKKKHFVDMLIGLPNAAVDLRALEQLFLQQRYADLPEPISLARECESPYSMQIVVLPNVEEPQTKIDIVKHVRFEGGPVMDSTIWGLCRGSLGPFDIHYQGHFRDGPRAFQYLLECMGGFQVRYNRLIPSGGKNVKEVRQTEDIKAGFEFIRKEGPEENNDGEFTEFAEIQTNDPDSLIYKWDRHVVMEFLRARQDRHSQAETIADWPLTLVSIAGWALNLIVFPLLPHLLDSAIIWVGKSEIGKSPVSHTLACVASLFWQLQGSDAPSAATFQTANDLDYFRKEKGKRTKPRVFDDGNLSACLRQTPPPRQRGSAANGLAGAWRPSPTTDASTNARA